MKTIPTQFTKYREQFNLIERCGNIAIYHRARPGGTPGYEVMRVRHREEREFNSRTIPAGEYLPSIGDWSRYA